MEGVLKPCFPSVFINEECDTVENFWCFVDNFVNVENSYFKRVCPLIAIVKKLGKY